MCFRCCHSLLRKPVNLLYDPYRYRAFLIFYSIDMALFIIRLALVSNDLSANAPTTKDYLIPILIFDLIASVTLIICNSIYIVMRHCVVGLFDIKPSNQFIWRLATMTCFRFDFSIEHPQLILLTRVFLVIGFFLLRFMCFVIGASCSARFKSQCTAYTVFAVFTLANLLLIIVVEFIHYFRLWTYNPTKIINNPRGTKFTNISSDAVIEKTHRCHLRFIHYSMINDQNAPGFGRSLCSKGAECRSESLHHQLIYHSLESSRQVPNIINDNGGKSTVIAFYETTKENMFKIVQNGFPKGDNLPLEQSIFFTPSIKSNLDIDKAILCVRINLGRFEVIDNSPVNLNQYFQGGDGLKDTIYVTSESRFYLRMTGQIEKWIVMVSRETKVNDHLENNYYVGCFS
ncbi:unnamed protein product [Rotaria magnacalcarata]|uniref:Uncharacterized protein n=1 Tax=Rotaria magnacalcarata TaxID=392030 RepID=A0A816ZVE1_9BILA|nr:unnamed protein product [Rotaria magnacalcarata]CAF4082699.1 unnamed protein product [Rotaria magnacalcarata]